VNPFYLAGIACIGAGCALIYAAGVRDGLKEQDADDTKMGAVADVRVVRDRNNPVGDSA
jgi:hypothetical protein